MDREEEDPTVPLALVFLVMALNSGEEETVDACARDKPEIPTNGEGSKWQDPKDSGQTSANRMCYLPLLQLPSAMAPFLCSLTSDVCWHYSLKSPVTHWTPSLTAFLQTLHAPKLSVQAIMNEVSFLLLPSDRVSFLARSLCVHSLLMALCLQTQGSAPCPRCSIRTSYWSYYSVEVSKNI